LKTIDDILVRYSAGREEHWRKTHDAMLAVKVPASLREDYVRGYEAYFKADTEEERRVGQLLIDDTRAAAAFAAKVTKLAEQHPDAKVGPNGFLLEFPRQVTTDRYDFLLARLEEMTAAEDRLGQEEEASWKRHVQRTNDYEEELMAFSRR